jgi:flavin reductase (DIM6/NTAB) family NADH-FMN oxidoreductase RutF
MVSAMAAFLDLLDDNRTCVRAGGGAYATGVAVVSTARPDGSLCGITVNSFASLSLAPPLVLWSLGAGSARYDTFASAALWGVTVLAAADEAMARRMVRPELEGLSAGEVDDFSGVPVLKTGLVHLACRTHVQHILGDHLLIVGEVLSYRARAGAALTFYRGRYGAAADEG